MFFLCSIAAKSVCAAIEVQCDQPSTCANLLLSVDIFCHVFVENEGLLSYNVSWWCIHSHLSLPRKFSGLWRRSKVLDVPDPDALAEEFPEKLPCAAYPSDHLSLVADVLVP